MLGEPAAPFAHRVGGCLDAQADVLVLRAFRGQKDDAGPLRQPLRSLSPRRQTLKLTPLPLRQIDRNRRLAHRQSSAESIRKENCTYLPITTLAPFALGSGRAGGIAHVLALEALDEMGILWWRSRVRLWAPLSAARMPPESRGALFGITYSRSDVMSKLLRARVGCLADLILRGRGNPALLAPEICLDVFWLSGILTCFEDLAIKSPLSSQPLS